MAPTGKKTAKKSPPKPRTTAAKKARPKPPEGVESLKRQLTDALEQQAATREILALIADSPMDLQPVLDTVARCAAQLCDARDAQIFRVDGEVLRLAASNGTVHVRESAPIVRGSVTGRAVTDRQTVHVHDLALVADSEFPESKPFQRRFGDRSVLATPLLRRGIPIGAILIRRFEVRPFTDRQIQLLDTFAAQAVVAIENVRLFQEHETRNRDLAEASEQQTATSEILRVIAKSPTDIQPVLDTVVATAARLCEASDAQIRLSEGDGTRLVASVGIHPAPEYVPNNHKTPATQAFSERRPIHIHDLLAEVEKYPDSREVQTRTGSRTFLSVPMLREGQSIGLINIRRTEVRPFSERQIQLLETFASQAVIAIENVRLFKELQERTQQLVESVEEMKALSEVGQAVSSTPIHTTLCSSMS